MRNLVKKKEHNSYFRKICNVSRNSFFLLTFRDHPKYQTISVIEVKAWVMIFINTSNLFVVVYLVIASCLKRLYVVNHETIWTRSPSNQCAWPDFLVLVSFLHAERTLDAIGSSSPNHSTNSMQCIAPPSHISECIPLSDWCIHTFTQPGLEPKSGSVKEEIAPVTVDHRKRVWWVFLINFSLTRRDEKIRVTNENIDSISIKG